jgi:hypothetical protein
LTDRVLGRQAVAQVRPKQEHRGRLPNGRIDWRWLKQAYAERELLERSTDMQAEALLVLSDAYLVGSVPARPWA